MSYKNSTFIQAHIARKYTIIQKVGSGAYGHVWRVQDSKTKQILALKKIFDAFQHSTDAQRTYRQVAILQQLDHPNIIKLQETLQAENNKDLYMVMQYVEADLYHVISENILKDIHRKFIVYQLAKALKYLHSGKLIHRDLKPSNILINSQCLIKLCDFGLVRCLASKGKENDEDFSPVLTEGVATRWYRAPEVLLGSKSYSTPADVWSLGCVIYQLVTGKPLFSGNSTIDQLEKIVQVTGFPSNQDIDSLQSQLAYTTINTLKSRNFNILEGEKGKFQGINSDFVDILHKMLEFNPTRRITMEDLLHHPMLKPFRKPQQQIVCKGPITTILDDNCRQSVERYKAMVYGSKRYSLSRTSNPMAFTNKQLRKVNSEKVVNNPNGIMNTTSSTNSTNEARQYSQENFTKQRPVLKYIKSTQNLISKNILSNNSVVLRQSTKCTQKVVKTSFQDVKSIKAELSKTINYGTTYKPLKKTSQKPIGSLATYVKIKERDQKQLKPTRELNSKVQDK